MRRSSVSMGRPVGVADGVERRAGRQQGVADDAPPPEREAGGHPPVGRDGRREHADQRLLTDVGGEHGAVPIGERARQAAAELGEEVVQQAGREVQREHRLVPAGLAEAAPVAVDLGDVRLHRLRGDLPLLGEQVDEGGVLGEDRGRDPRDRLAVGEVGGARRDVDAASKRVSSR